MSPSPVVSRLRAIPVAAIVVLAGCSTPATSPSPSAESTEPSVAASQSQAAEAGALPPPELTEVRIALSSERIEHVQYIQATNLGEKYGFSNLEFIGFDGASPAAQALFAGQVDVADNSGGPVVSSLATDSPLIMTFVSRHNLTDILYGQPEVQSADDLRGGSIAISSFGSQSHAGAILALAALGLTPEDVTITQVGNDSARSAALEAGSVTASLNDSAIERQLADAGFNVLVRLAEEANVGGVVRSSLTFPQEFVDQYPNTVLNLTAMWMEANLKWREEPDLMAERLSEVLEIPLDEARSDLDALLEEPWDPFDGRCNPDVMQFTLETLLPLNPELESVDPNDGCTNEFIDQLEELGFLQEIGVPGY
ncbi:MAG TPA: ABC transporter substrate-binding protein [Candidatus Limnocylindrales bacterium]|nr:ABC transporter substrate-binding protein [Candidatus Limnocylindrales bacterium]